MKFKIGDKAVYPSHGLGIIKSIETKEVFGVTQSFYVFEVISSGVTFMIPTTAPERSGIRELISNKDIKNVYSILTSPCVPYKTSWNKKFKFLNDKLRTGSIEEIAEVIRDLNPRSTSKKDLSFGEKKMFDKAKSLLISEISAVSSKKACDIEQDLQEMLIRSAANTQQL